MFKKVSLCSGNSGLADKDYCYLTQTDRFRLNIEYNCFVDNKIEQFRLLEFLDCFGLAGRGNLKMLIGQFEYLICE